MGKPTVFDSHNFDTDIAQFTGDNTVLVGHANQVVDRVNAIGKYLSNNPTGSDAGGDQGRVDVVVVSTTGALSILTIPGGILKAI